MDEPRDETLEGDAPPPQGDEEMPIQKVTDLPRGAKRDGYFKRRDYEDEVPDARR